MILRINEDHWVNTDNVSAIELRRDLKTKQWECVILTNVQMVIGLRDDEVETLKLRLDELGRTYIEI